MNLHVRETVAALGPAWLVMIADVDVASIVTGLQAGASWGYHMIFVMLLLTVPLFLIQDAAGRLGTVGRVGLGEAIGHKYGRRTALFAALPMAVTDFLEYVAEYAGIAIGLTLLGLPVLLGLLVAYGVHMAIVVGREYRQAEILLLPVSFALVATLVASVLLFHVDLGQVAREGLSPIQPYGDPSFRYLAAASIGAVVMPWMLYFHSGADARKGLGLQDVRRERRTTLVSAVVSELVMAAIVIVGVQLPALGGAVGVQSAAGVLAPIGPFATTIVGIGFLAAGFLALVVVSMGSTWGVMEAAGTTSRRSLLSIYVGESAPALLLVVFTTSYVPLILGLMVSFTVIIIPSLFFLGRLVSDPDTMRGRPFRRTETIAFWAASAAVVGGGLLGMLAL
ncbi:MAG TPA: divalent metal cation transporter [Thermoplasmata archaeon]|nr:divalent metal cation transporter [Thermoplasmata archaeon]